MEKICWRSRALVELLACNVVLLKLRRGEELFWRLQGISEEILTDPVAGVESQNGHTAL